MGGYELKQKHQYEDDKWKHYDFLRMIWILFKQNGRRKGLDAIWKLTPFNVTYTYFWSQLVYFGMNKEINAEKNEYVQQNFDFFLVMNPCFSNNFDGLMNKYYSKKLMNVIDSKENKTKMLLPDIMALPALITDVQTLKKKKNNQ